MITGQDLHKILLETVLEGDNLDETAYDWEALSPYERDALSTAATALNGTFLAPLQGRVAELEQKNQRLSAKVEELEQENAALQARIGELEQENVELEAEIAEDAIEIEVFKQKNGAQAQEIDALKTLVEEMNQTLLYCHANMQPTTTQKGA